MSASARTTGAPSPTTPGRASGSTGPRSVRSGPSASGPARSATPAARETIHHPAAVSLDLALVLRTVGDPLRLAMVRSLAREDEILCGAVGERLGLPKSTASYHLRLLREAGVTRTRQDGTLRFISLRRDDLEARFPGLVDVLTAGEDG